MGTCKDCKWYKRQPWIADTRVGECTFLESTDCRHPHTIISKRIRPGADVLFHRNRITIAEDFGCIHFTAKECDEQTNGI
jgi:hypothetical protein